MKCSQCLMAVKCLKCLNIWLWIFLEEHLGCIWNGWWMTKIVAQLIKVCFVLFLIQLELCWIFFVENDDKTCSVIPSFVWNKEQNNVDTFMLFLHVSLRKKRNILHAFIAAQYYCAQILFLGDFFMVCLCFLLHFNRMNQRKR